MATEPLPAWATTPGATVILEPGSYGRERAFHKATITRVTKSSVFVRVGENGRERRFVNTGWVRDNERLREYGTSGGFHASTYIWNPDAESIKKALVTYAKRARELALAKAAENLASAIRRGDDYAEQVPAVLDALVEAGWSRP